MHNIPARLRTFLRKQPFTTISTCSLKRRMPHTAIVCFVMDPDLTFYFVTHGSSRKVQDIIENPNVSGVHWAMGGMNVQWQGHAEIVPMPQADVIMDRVIKKMVSVPDFWPPIFKFREHDYVVIKITPTYMTMMEIKAQTISSPLPGYEVVLDT